MSLWDQAVAAQFQPVCVTGVYSEKGRASLLCRGLRGASRIRPLTIQHPAKSHATGLDQSLHPSELAPWFSCHRCVSRKCDCRERGLPGNPSSRAYAPALFPLTGEGGSYRDLLDSNKLELRRIVSTLQTELDDFSSPLHQGVEILRLGMATAQGGNGGHVEPVFVLLDDDSEFSRCFHRAILARVKPRPIFSS